MILLLLLFIPLASASDNPYRYVVACREGGDVQFYNPETSDWKEPLLVHLDTCDFNSVLRLCRNVFVRSSYGVDMNVSKEIDGKEYQLFQCQDFTRAVLPTVPQGSWSDSLIVASHKLCMTEEVLRKAAEADCDRNISHIAFGGKCGETATYLEVAFICDSLNRGDIFKDDLSVSASFHERQFEALETYVQYHKLKMFAKQEGNRTAVEKYDSLMAKTLREGMSAVGDDFRLTVWNGKRISYDPSFPFKSRRRDLNTFKYEMIFSGRERAANLLQMAADLLTGERKFDLTRPSDKETLRSADIAYAISYRVGRTSLFPEIRATLSDVYVEYCRNRTLGIDRDNLEFLREAGEVDNLITIYEEIFRDDGFIDKKYLSKELKRGRRTRKIIVFSAIGVVLVGVGVFVALKLLQRPRTSPTKTEPKLPN